MQRKNTLVSFNVNEEIKGNFKRFCEWENISMSARVNEFMRLYVRENMDEYKKDLKKYTKINRNRDLENGRETI